MEAYFGLFHEDGKLKSSIEGLELDNETAETSEAGSTEAEPSLAAVAALPAATRRARPDRQPRRYRLREQD